jgi:hypothetical protein
MLMMMLLSSSWLAAETILWYSDADGVNLDGAGNPMDSAFQFELGVFAGGFQPTASNYSQWAAYWTSADSTPYLVNGQRFNGSLEVVSNDAPFTVGAKGWVLGTKTTTTGTEKILFRRSDWLWPAPNPMNPVSKEWRANAGGILEVVMGELDPAETQFLMRSQTLRTYDQWRALELDGEPLNNPNDDPDRDGVPNLLEFVFGSNPNIPGTPPLTDISIVDVGGNDHLQISIPRRRDHIALLKVQVSSDLVTWNDGDAFTEVVADGSMEWVVRDKTPFPPAGGRRFMRLQASLPAP